MAVDINIFKSAYTAEQIKQALDYYRTQIAVPFDSATAYVVNDFVVYNGLLYQCTANTTAGEDWDADQWELQKIFDNEGYYLFYSEGTNVCTIPTVAGPVQYTGSKVSPVFIGFDSTKSTKSGVYEATNVGTYTAIFSLINPNKYEWSDGTTTAKNVQWSIVLEQVELPVVSGLSYTYDGTTKSASVSYDTTKCTLTGATSGINAGTYTFTISLNNPTGTQWADGTTAPKTYNLVIAKAVTSSPSLAQTSYMYNGSLISPNFIYDSTAVTTSGTLSAIESGNYTAYFTPDGNHTWEDSTSTTKSINWVIIDSIVLDQFVLESGAFRLEFIER